MTPAGPAGPRALYLHVPFCERLCPYCDFAVHVGGAALHRRYVDAVRSELETVAAAVADHRPLTSVFVGGGTPSRLPAPLLRRLLEAVGSALGIAGGAEVTLEANPSDVVPAAAAAWLAAGVTRVSLGVQSLDDDVLRQLGRAHDAAAALGAIRVLREAGLRHLSCDLIYAIPGRPAASFSAGLEQLLEFHPEHLSCYELTVEPGTRLHRQVARGLVRPLAPAAALAQHWGAVDRLQRAGYDHYEVSNFARPGERCRHTRVYWRGGPYWGIGAGAHGHLPVPLARRLGLEVPAGTASVRLWNHRATPRYLGQVERDGHGRAGWEGVRRDQRRLERWLLGLRRPEGVRLATARDRAEARALAVAALVTVVGGRVRVTRRGAELLDQVALRLAG